MIMPTRLNQHYPKNLGDTKMINREITFALLIADEKIRQNRWALLRVTDTKVTLEIGPVNFDGSRDKCSMTYRFYSDYDGIPRYVTDVHP